MKQFIPVKDYISIVKDKLKEELKCYNTRPILVLYILETTRHRTVISKALRKIVMSLDMSSH